MRNIIRAFALACVTFAHAQQHLTKWTQIGGHDARTPVPVAPSEASPGSRLGIQSWVTYDQGGARIWMFGGVTLGTQVLGDLWYYIVGTEGAPGGKWHQVPTPHGGPANRTGASTWVINSEPCSMLVMFGGTSSIYLASMPLDDVWIFNTCPGNMQWSKVANPGDAETPPVSVRGRNGGTAILSGSLATGSDRAWPEGRAGAITWQHPETGDVFVFGGTQGNPVASTLNDNDDYHVMNEMWRFTLNFDSKNATTGWFQIKIPEKRSEHQLRGARGNSTGPVGVWPQARSFCQPLLCSHGVSWVDKKNRFWLFGGVSDNGDLLNDMWHYDPKTQQWGCSHAACDHGYQPLDQPGDYVQTPFWPGSRIAGSMWVDANGDLLMYGGYGLGHLPADQAPGDTKYGFLNDMWRFNGTQWTEWQGSWTADGSPPTESWPGARAGAALWAETGDFGSFTIMYGGENFDPVEQPGGVSRQLMKLDDMWAIDLRVPTPPPVPPPPPTPPTPMTTTAPTPPTPATSAAPTPTPTPDDDDGSGGSSGFSFSHGASIALIASVGGVATIAAAIALAVFVRRRRARAAQEAAIDRLHSTSKEFDGPGSASPLLRSPRRGQPHGRMPSRGRRGSHDSIGASPMPRSRRLSSDGSATGIRGRLSAYLGSWFGGDGNALSNNAGFAHARGRGNLGPGPRSVSSEGPLDDTNDMHLSALLGEYGAADLLIPFDEVEIMRKLAAGGGGNVYLGKMSGVAVVLKEVFSQVVDESYGPAEFWHEAKMLHMLNHPHVVQFLGVTQNTKGDLMLLTEFCPQGSFADVIERHEYEPRKQFLRHATQLAKTMRWLHAKDVIHRDLKPQNVLIDSNGNLKLCDLGLARVQGSDSRARASLTAGAGSPAYMSPEAMRAPEGSRSQYDGKAADVYSCAMVLVYMWTQRKLYEGMSTFQIITAVSKPNGLRPKLPPSVPPRLAALVRSMWSENPGQRPTFAQIVDTLGDTRLLISAAGSGTVVARRQEDNVNVGDMGGTNGGTPGDMHTQTRNVSSSNSRSRTKESQRGGTNSRTARLNGGLYTQLSDE